MWLSKHSQYLKLLVKDQSFNSRAKTPYQVQSTVKYSWHYALTALSTENGTCTYQIYFSTLIIFLVALSFTIVMTTNHTHVIELSFVCLFVYWCFTSHAIELS